VSSFDDGHDENSFDDEDDSMSVSSIDSDAAAGFNDSMLGKRCIKERAQRGGSDLRRSSKSSDSSTDDNKDKDSLGSIRRGSDSPDSAGGEDRREEFQKKLSVSIPSKAHARRGAATLGGATAGKTIGKKVKKSKRAIQGSLAVEGEEKEKETMEHLTVQLKAKQLFESVGLPEIVFVFACKC
jgi:hypothetical protein